MKTVRSLAVSGALAASALFIPFASQAGVVTSLPGGTVLPMPAIDYEGAGPQVMAPGVTWSSASGGSVYGWADGYGFGGNGFWSGTPMMGTNDTVSTMTVSFASPVAGVGAFLNYVEGMNASIAVYDSSNNLIESMNLTFSTGGGDNTGMFYGFSESSANIAYFTMTGGYIGAADLTYTGQAATDLPEPASIALLSLGMIGIAALRRKAASQA